MGNTRKRKGHERKHGGGLEYYVLSKTWDTEEQEATKKAVSDELLSGIGGGKQGTREAGGI